MRKSLVTMLTMALVGGALFAVPAEAKKKKPKKPKPAVCSAYVPGEQGAEAETVVVPATATEEAPVEIPITLHESLGDVDFVGAGLPYSNQIVNLQVDSATPDAGLYILFEFDTKRDYDLRVFWPTGEEVAASHGFQPVLEANAELPLFGNPSNQGGNAGESTNTSEKIVGLRTPDCGGYTVDFQNWLGEGGDFTAKAWLGEAVNEPIPAEG
jgi:hypothetical protein